MNYDVIKILDSICYACSMLYKSSIIIGVEPWIEECNRNHFIEIIE